MTLRPNAWSEWIAGGYFRAYALHKEPRELELASELLTLLQNEAIRRIPDSVLTRRIQRLRGRVLITRGDASGRDEILQVFKAIGGTNAKIAYGDKELARLASDLCGDLSLIGEHKSAIQLAERVAAREVEAQELKALRLSNLASWLNQRAVAARASGDAEAARRDLDLAMWRIEDALNIRNDLRQALDHDQQLELRECRAIQLSIGIERAWVDRRRDLSQEIDEMKMLLNATLSVGRPEETPLQIAYRIGRLGVAHLRSTAKKTSEERRVNLMRAQAYLQYAWEFGARSLLRPWIALDLCETLKRAKLQREAAETAAASLNRLVPQCGPSYPVNKALRAYL